MLPAAPACPGALAAAWEHLGDTAVPPLCFHGQVRIDAALSARTRLTFCTAGVLLRRLLVDPLVEDVRWGLHPATVPSSFSLTCSLPSSGHTS